MEKIWNFIRDENGLETVEYAVMAFLIVTGLVLVVTGLGGRVAQILTDLTTELGS